MPPLTQILPITKYANLSLASNLGISHACLELLAFQSAEHVQCKSPIDHADILNG